MTWPPPAPIVTHPDCDQCGHEWSFHGDRALVVCGANTIYDANRCQCTGYRRGNA